MNKWNRLLASLDRIFGMNNKERSTFRKLSQNFDEKTNWQTHADRFRKSDANNYAKLARSSDTIKRVIDSFEKRPMRISMRVVIAPTMILTG